MLELRNVSKAGRRRRAYPRRVADARARLAQRAARADAVGQDQPDAADGRARRADLGHVWFDGENVTGVPVQKRNVAMVYQQFINYPAMTVYENIASPLRVAGADAAQDRPRGQARRGAAEADALSRSARRSACPAASSSAPRSRAPSSRMPALVLLDEPLANLDYKLREELRAELPRSSPKAARSSSMRRPSRTRRCCSAATRRRCRKGASRSSGRRSRCSASRTTSSRREPSPIRRSTPSCCARRAQNFLLDGGVNLPVPAELAGIADASYTIGFQPHHLSLARPNASAVVGHREGLGHRDHRLGELRPSRLRRRALGDAGARHPRLRAGRDDRGVHRSAAHHGVRRERPRGGGGAMRLAA